MSIILPNGLPAAAQLRAEGLVVREGVGAPSAGRPLRIALLNIMPKKPTTETQIARLLASTRLPVELVLMRPEGYRPKTTSAQHLERFYRSWDEVRRRPLDGLIVTGAPVETLPFEAVDYWPELMRMLDWAATETAGSLFICWAAQAALYHHYGVPKRALSEKRFGVYRQGVTAPDAATMRGFTGSFPVPVSRHTETAPEDLPRDAGLRVLAESPESGLCLIEDPAQRAHYMFNHWEYDATTLPEEYARDRAAGQEIALPHNVFPKGDSSETPVNSWRPTARLFFANWLRGLAAERARRSLSHSVRSSIRTPGFAAHAARPTMDQCCAAC